ncbi:MAG: XrtA-associated tyrosine autokinase [Betaproteobacteria bacterium]
MSRIEKALENALRQREPSPALEPLQSNDPAMEALKPTNPNIIGFDDQLAPIAEEYKKLRSMILQMTKRKENHNTIMVTSAESGEGKSLTAINLALVLAQEYNHTVLLIDADLRRPSLQTYLGLEPGLGLTDCLFDGIDVSQALIKAGTPKLSFLGAGRKASNPAELLSSNKMKSIVHELKSRYRDRYIIIDTPPVLAFAETHVMSSYVDGVLFVVKEGVASSSVHAALDILNIGNVLGIVFNNASAERLQGRYSHYYHYYYDQRRGETKETKG